MSTMGTADREPTVTGAAQGPPSGGTPGTRHRGGAGGAALAALTIMVPLTAMLLLRHGREAVDADSVAQQSLIQTWRTLGHGTTYLPQDTWLLKLPFYALIEPLPLSPDTRLLVETATLNALGYLLLAWGVWLLAGQLRLERRWWDVALPAAWVVSTSGGIGQYLSIMPNYRNIELGLTFLGLAAAGAYLRERRPLTDAAPALVGSDAAPALVGSDAAPSRRRWRSVAGIGAGVLGPLLLWLDDPYFAMLVGLPLTLGCLLWFALRLTGRDRRLLVVAGATGLSLAAVPLGRIALEGLFRIRVVEDAIGPTVDPAQWVAHLGLLWPSLSAQLGLDTGHGVAAWGSHGLALAVLAAGAVGSVVLAGWCLRSRRALGPVAAVGILVALLWLVVVVGVVANRTVFDFHAGRYLMPGVLFLAVTAGLAAAVTRRRHPRLAAAMTGLLGVAVVANLGFGLLERPAVPPHFQWQRDTLAALRAGGATKGYAQFWSTNLYIQRSDGEFAINDVSCWKGELLLRHWITDTARSAAPAPGGRTFVLLEPTQTNLDGCDPEAVQRQLGPAARTLPAPLGATILIYDRDPLEALRR